MRENSCLASMARGLGDEQTCVKCSWGCDAANRELAITRLVTALHS